MNLGRISAFDLQLTTLHLLSIHHQINSYHLNIPTSTILMISYTAFLSHAQAAWCNFPSPRTLKHITCSQNSSRWLRRSQETVRWYKRGQRIGHVVWMSQEDRTHDHKAWALARNTRLWKCFRWTYFKFFSIFIFSYLPRLVWSVSSSSQLT